MILPFLETMITQVCNLSCEGCSNYSDLQHSGYVSWSQGRADLEAWQSRIEIQEFGIIGGEPLINPEWRDWIIGSRQLFPDSQLRFTTNGLLLHKATDLLSICEHVGNIVLKITVHVKDRDLDHSIEKLRNSRSWQPVIEHGINRWIGKNGVRLQINTPTHFVKTYKNTYSDMAPWRSDPREAFAKCCQQMCPLLFQGRIYKCSTAGLLRSTLIRHGDPNIDQWQPYLTDGISVNDTDASIQDFCDNFGKPHHICGQCPGTGSGSLDHITKVTFKKKTVAYV